MCLNKWYLRSLEYDNEYKEEIYDEKVTFDDFEMDESEEVDKAELPSVDITQFKLLGIKKMWEKKRVLSFNWIIALFLYFHWNKSSIIIIFFL